MAYWSQSNFPAEMEIIKLTTTCAVHLSLNASASSKYRFRLVCRTQMEHQARSDCSTNNNVILCSLITRVLWKLISRQIFKSINKGYYCHPYESGVGLYKYSTLPPPISRKLNNYVIKVSKLINSRSAPSLSPRQAFPNAS